MVNKKLLVLEFALVLLVSIGAVSAFGVGAPYWKENPLSMYPGETKIVNFNLQNMVGTGDVNVKVMMLEGSEIATLEKDTYFVKFGTSDVMVPLTVKLPETASPGSRYNIKLDFKTINSGEGGGVAMGVGMGEEFAVIVAETPQAVAQPTAPAAPIGMYLSLIMAAVIIIVVISILAGKKKKE